MPSFLSFCSTLYLIPCLFSFPLQSFRYSKASVCLSVCLCVCAHFCCCVSARLQMSGGRRAADGRHSPLTATGRERLREREAVKRGRERERERKDKWSMWRTEGQRREGKRERGSDKRQLRGSSRPNSGNIANTQLCLRGRSVQGNWWSENTSEICSLHLRQCFWELTPLRSEAHFTFVFYSHSKIFHARSV